MKRLIGSAGHSKQAIVSRQVASENTRREELVARKSVETKSDCSGMSMRVPILRRWLGNKDTEEM